MRQIPLPIERETSSNGWLGERRLGGGLHRGIQCVGADRLRHNFLQRGRVSANTHAGSLSGDEPAASRWRKAMMGGIKAQYDCINPSETDFTEDLKATLHGDDDQIVPIADSSLNARTAWDTASMKVAA